MRNEFGKIIFDLMSKDKNVYFLTADLGYKLFDKVLQRFPERAYNVGASEQLMLGASVGLALSGKIPICYSITPFLIYRPFELIRNYINHESIPVVMVGSGRGKDYHHDGFSHWAEDDLNVLSLFKNITTFHPSDKNELSLKFEKHVYQKKPLYVNLRRS